MNIISAEYDRTGQIIVTVEDQPPDMVITVPDDMANRDRQELAAWEAAGNSIRAYQVPPAPPPEDTVEAAGPTPTEALILEQLASISSRLDTLEQAAKA